MASVSVPASRCQDVDYQLVPKALELKIVVVIEQPLPGGSDFFRGLYPNRAGFGLHPGKGAGDGLQHGPALCCWAHPGPAPAGAVR